MDSQSTTPNRIRHLVPVLVVVVRVVVIARAPAAAWLRVVAMRARTSCMGLVIAGDAGKCQMNNSAWAPFDFAPAALRAG